MNPCWLLSASASARCCWLLERWNAEGRAEEAAESLIGGARRARRGRTGLALAAFRGEGTWGWAPWGTPWSEGWDLGDDGSQLKSGLCGGEGEGRGTRTVRALAWFNSLSQ